MVFDGEHGAVSRQQVHEGYKASRPADDQARLPLTFLPKRGLDHCGIAWIELDYAEADDVIATVVHATTTPRPVIIMSRDKDYYQLITDRVVVLNTRFRAGHKLVTPDEVYRRHQVTPHSGPITGRWPGTPLTRSPACTASAQNRGNAAERWPDPR